MLSIDVKTPGLPLLRRLILIVAVHIRVFVVEVARKITVIIRTRVCRIVPVQSRVAVLTGSPKSCGTEFQLICRSSVVLQHEHRLESAAHAGIANHAVLITPVAVIHIVSHKVIYLLSGSVLSAPFARSGECHKGQSTSVLKFLLGSCVIRKIFIINTFNPIIATQTGRYVHCIAPAIVHLT